METATRKTGSRTSGRKKKTYVVRRVRRTQTSKAVAGSADAPRPQPIKLTPEQRYRAIAEAAYYKAEARGFQGGDPAQDWREAEAEIDAWILGSEGGER